MTESTAVQTFLTSPEHLGFLGKTRPGTKLTVSEGTINPLPIRAATGIIAALEFVVGVIQYEGRPEVFGGSALESAIYSTTWREWDGDKLVRAVNDRRDFSEV